MKFLKAFGQFWYDFIIGDDWKIAVAVVLALVVLFAAMTLGLFGDTGLTLLGGAGHRRVQHQPGHRRPAEEALKTQSLLTIDPGARPVRTGVGCPADGSVALTTSIQNLVASATVKWRRRSICPRTGGPTVTPSDQSR